MSDNPTRTRFVETDTRGRRGRRSLALAVTAVALALAIPAGAAATNTMDVLPNGEVILAGRAFQPAPACQHRTAACAASSVEWPALVRLDSAGSLDPRFGSGGALVDFRWGPGSFPAVAAQPTRSRIFATSRLGVASFLEGGAPAFEFGENGIAEVPDLVSTGGKQPESSVVLPLPDGSIDVGGSRYPFDGERASISRATAVSFDRQGTFQETVGEIPELAGKDLGGSALTDMLFTAKGIVFTGITRETVIWDPRLLTRELLLGRFVPMSGTAYDGSFREGQGFLSWPLDPTEGETWGRGARGEAIARDGGKLLVAGAFGETAMLARFDEDGNFDQGFGDGGFTSPGLPGSYGSEATALAVQPDGKVVVAGHTVDVCPNGPPTSHCFDLFVDRFRPDGSIDTSFGSGGFARLATNDQSVAPGDVDLATLADGKLLVSESPVRERESFVLARLNADGTLDRSFGDGGMTKVQPCMGTIAQRRRLGCIASASASLRVVGLAGFRPHGDLSVRIDNALDPVASVRILLPPALRGRPAAAGAVKVVTVGRHATRVRVRRHSIVLDRMGSPRGIHAGIRAGVLRATKPIATGRRLVFRVEVRCVDGSVQTFRLVRTA